MNQGNSKGNGRMETAGAERLVGWLVSYQLDEQGAAYEIRAGRSFLSSKSMQGDKIITVAEPSVCSPHLALSASAKHRVVIQDIFSKHGSYLTRSGSRDEKEISGPVEVEHGDWIRVGERTRFQVCMIHGGGK